MTVVRDIQINVLFFCIFIIYKEKIFLIYFEINRWKTDLIISH